MAVFVNSENIADYGSCYWNDAPALTCDTKGSSRLLQRIDAIHSSEQQLFDGADFAAMNLTYARPDRFAQIAPTTWVYVYNNVDRYGFLETSSFQKGSGEFRIVHQTLVVNVALP